MADDIQLIRSLLRGLVFRERLLLAARVGLRTAALGLLCVAFLLLAPLLQVDRATGVFLVVVLAGVGIWAAVAWPLLREWSRTGDPMRQATRVEAARPALRGRLLTAVDSTSAPIPEERAPLLALVVGRAAKAVHGVRAGEIHRLRGVLPAVAAGAASAHVLLVSAAVVGPTRAAAFWLRGSDALAAIAAEAVIDPEDLARVGDLTLRYTFPDYTGLEPKVVANGTGEVEAPPGTRVEVSARAADPAEAAGIVAYEEPLEATLEPDGRGLHGAFTVGPAEGVWRFQLYRGGTSESSRDFPVKPLQDLPPDVTLSVGEGLDTLEVAVDRPFPLEWAARDDYGVRKVAFAIDGKELDTVIERPQGRRADLQGARSPSPRDLGLKAGARVRLSVVAWDNDTVSGSKKGESRAVEILVIGADGTSGLGAERREDFVEALVPILSEYLVEPWPPGETGAELGRWGEVVSRRYTPLTELADAQWRGRTGTSLERTVVTKVITTGQALVRYTQTAFEPAGVERAPADNVEMAAELRTAALEAAESALLALAKIGEYEAYGDLAEQAQEMEDAAEEMRQTLAQENPDLQELLSQLDALEAKLAELAETAARLGDSPLREYVQARESEMKNLGEEIRKAIAEGRLDDARKLMERLAQAMSDLAEGTRQQMERAQGEAEDSANEAQDAVKELRDLEREQRALQSEAQALQERSGRDSADLWRQIGEKAAEHAAAAGAYGAGLDAAGRQFYERERAAGGVEAASDLESAVGARDLRGARAQVLAGRQAWAMARRALEGELARRQGRLQGPGRDDLAALQAQLDAIEALLDQLEQQSAPDEATQQAARDLEERQRQLEQRTQAASEKAKGAAEQLQVQPEGMGEALDQAQQRMDQAGDDLGNGRPMQAEGSQGQAAQRLGEAADALQQAVRQQQQMSQRGGKGEQSQGQEPGGEDGEGQGGEQEGGGELSTEELDIPGREEFRTPEEYRRALLEGMEGDVPEEYRAMKKRYFEELVAQ